MFRNYLKIALRNLKKNKLYTIVNIIGLAAGIASCLLIGVYVWTELSYDRFHKNADRIVRVTTDYSYSGTVSKFPQTGTKVGPQFKRTFPQIEDYVRMIKYDRAVSIGTRSFNESNVLYADASIFTIFSFPLLNGNSLTALNAPKKVVLSETAARKYFGSENPVGKTIRLDGGDADYEITGVVKDAPLNSQIQYNLIVSFSTLPASKKEIWNTANYITYLLLKDGKQTVGLASAIASYMKTVNTSEMTYRVGSSDYWTFHLEPLKDVHLHSPVGGGLEPSGNSTYIYVLIGIAILILLIACVNYTNLATAQSTSRGTEIGVRKVLGAGKQQLWRQFLGESFLLTCVSLIIALAVCVLLVPVLNGITGKTYSVFTFLSWPVLVPSIVLSALISLIAGTYPAFILTNTKLSSILKSGITITQSGGGLRKALIIVQFAIAIFLMAVTLIVTRQMGFIQNKNLGYHREQVLEIPIDYKTRAVYDQLKDAIRLNPNVLHVTGAYEGPTAIGWGDGISADNGDTKKELSVNAAPVDLEYLKTMGMELVAGRDFQRSDFALQDTTNDYKNYAATYILNEKAVKDLGWTPEKAIGQTISRGEPGKIVGVIKDFNFTSLHEEIGPLVVFLDTSLVGSMFIKIKPQHINQTISQLAAIWKSRVKHRPFDYTFLDDDFNRMYVAEQRTAALFTAFSTIAIVLSCLGLFALAAFVTIQRTKEIGIRKILGANERNIILLIARQFLILVFIAILIAVPVAWLAGNSWLNSFAYRIKLNGWSFAIAGCIAFVVAFFAVSYHALRAALSSPVKSLRSE